MASVECMFALSGTVKGFMNKIVPLLPRRMKASVYSELKPYRSLEQNCLQTLAGTLHQHLVTREKSL